MSEIEDFAAWLDTAKNTMPEQPLTIGTMAFLLRWYSIQKAAGEASPTPPSPLPSDPTVDRVRRYIVDHGGKATLGTLVTEATRQLDINEMTMRHLIGEGLDEGVFRLSDFGSVVNVSDPSSGLG